MAAVLAEPSVESRGCGMKGNHGSAFIPEGLLPDRREVGVREYCRQYDALRKKHDPHYRASVNKAQRDRRMGIYKTDLKLERMAKGKKA